MGRHGGRKEGARQSSLDHSGATVTGGGAEIDNLSLATGSLLSQATVENGQKW